MTRTWRTLFATTTGLLLLGTAVAQEQEPQGAQEQEPQGAQEQEPQWERDLRAVVPHGRWHVTASVVVGATRVIDELTGDGIPGARFLRYTEMSTPEAELIGATTTDHLGYAWLPLRDWRVDCHWLVLADGYAPEEGYGIAPDEEIELRPGRTSTFQILDGLGSPVADARVEAFQGCGHAPTARAGRTDANGFVTLHDVDDSEVVWVEDGPISPDYLHPDNELALGARRRFVLPTGVTATGKVTDPLGRPLRGVEVRKLGSKRGPAVLTGNDGSYRLFGVDPSEPLSFFHAQAEKALIVDADEWDADFPLTLALTPWGRAEADLRAGPQTVDVNVVDGAGGPAELMTLMLVRRADGRVFTEYTESAEYRGDDDPPPGRAQFRVPPGTWDLVQPDRFSSHTFEAQTCVTSEPLRVTVQARAQPRLSLEGPIPDKADLTLAVPGYEVEIERDEDTPWRTITWLPAGVRATVRVEHMDETFFFTVGPEKPDPFNPGGFLRTAVVDIPPPHTIQLDGSSDAGLFHRGVACSLHGLRSPYTTYATGDLVFQVTQAGAVVEYGITLPGGEATHIDLTDAIGQIDLPMNIAVTITEDFPEFVLVEARGAGLPNGSFDGSLIEPGTLLIPASGEVVVRLRRAGYATIKKVVDSPANVVPDWGGATLVLDVQTELDGAAEARVLVDGDTVVGEDGGDLTATGEIRVRGLTPGAHTVALIPTDHTLVGRELRLVLGDGETHRRVVLRDADDYDDYDDYDD